ncbi:MAG: LysE family transporter [Candidatus Bathyarchaeia archaeon]
MLELLGLLLLGFAVGLSGAVIPGPLLAFVILDSTKKRKVTGHFVILGHAIWEALVIGLILLGLSAVMKQYSTIIYVIGGAAMIIIGTFMVKNRNVEAKMESSKVNSSTLGGVFYTAFNPTQPIWWATAGLALLLEGSKIMGAMGIAIVTAGHWLADLAYYALVSYIVYRYGKYINPWQKQLSIVFGVFLTVLGIYFITLGTTEWLMIT